ncbi:flagellar basal body P-ring formation chaperone FlgA [Chitinimonas sp. PSY-7]|uniref:flagellar basal body P-ring formation chaperone FlgA n=1 Tax=Chitinimonas sp. PSY-7 TaxID=3459088 RepID=UPI00403FDB01
MLRCIPFLLLFSATLALADDAVQSHAAISDAASQFLAGQLADHGDRATYQLARLDSRLRLAPCQQLDVKLAQGNRLIGNSSVRVVCNKGAKWSVNIPVAISIQTDYWVSARALPAGQELTENDIEQRSGDLAQLPPTVVTEYKEAIGRTLVGGTAAGAPIRSDQLRAPFTIKANEMVRVVAKGNGFEVVSEGRAMSNAGEGQQISVKMISGATVQGIARTNSTVDVRY